MSTLPRRDGFLRRTAAGRFVLAVLFFELRGAALAALLPDFFFEEALEADFFRVTFLLAPLRFADDLPAFAVFLPVFFLLLRFLVGAFFFDADFFLLGVFLLVFFLAVFFDARLTGRFREPRPAAFFETLFLEAAFFFGMRSLLQEAPNEAGDYT